MKKISLAILLLIPLAASAEPACEREGFTLVAALDDRPCDGNQQPAGLWCKEGYTDTFWRSDNDAAETRGAMFGLLGSDSVMLHGARDDAYGTVTLVFDYLIGVPGAECPERIENNVFTVDVTFGTGQVEAEAAVNEIECRYKGHIE